MILFSFSTDIFFSFFFFFFIGRGFWYIGVWAPGYFFSTWVISEPRLSCIAVSNAIYSHYTMQFADSMTSLLAVLSKEFCLILFLPRPFFKVSFLKRPFGTCQFLTVWSFLDRIVKTRARVVYMIFWLWVSRMGILTTLVDVQIGQLKIHIYESRHNIHIYIYI